jgi:hypothetical protein
LYAPKGQFSQLNSAWHEKTTSPVMMADDQKRLLEEAGFVDIQVTNKWIDAGCFTNGIVLSNEAF